MKILGIPIILIKNNKIRIKVGKGLAYNYEGLLQGCPSPTLFKIFLEGVLET